MMGVLANRLPTLGLGFLGLLASSMAASLGSAADPAVARPSFLIDGEIQTRGVVFFVRAEGPGGAAAIGTAHTFDLSKLVRVGRGDLLLGNSRRIVARTSGFLAPPGRPFDAAGATVADDYVIYALDRAPTGVRLLDLESFDRHEGGERVRILGVPTSGAGDEIEVTGVIAEVSASRIDVDLESPYDLRGWEGAPVLDASGDRVIGILQAYFPKGSTSRVIVAPIERARTALGDPLEGGAGRAFSAFEGSVGGNATVQPVQPRGSGGAPPRTVSAGSRRGRAYSRRPPGAIIPRDFDGDTQIHLTIDYPPEGAVVSDAVCGVFVSGRAFALHGDRRNFDVMLVIDTSRSTADPAGADINGNGIVGKPYLGSIGLFFDLGSTDSGDSVLAAEVAAARQLLRGLDPRRTRVGIVTFAGDPPDRQGGLFARNARRPAITIEPLSTDYARAEKALDSVLARGSKGSTHMAAGVDRATVELMGLRGALSKPSPDAEKIVLFFTDGQPTLPYPGADADNVRAVLDAVTRADRANIRIHSFAIGPHALDGPIATVEMARRTEGYFTPVRHPGDLVDVVEQVNFANLKEIRLRSVTSGEPADYFRATADGFWSGFLRMESGINQVEVVATASDGSEILQSVAVTMVKDAPELPLPDEMVVARNRLLENCLKAVKQVRLTAERERAEQVRKELRIEIERERATARQRADEQRKQLQLEISDEE